MKSVKVMAFLAHRRYSAIGGALQGAGGVGGWLELNAADYVERGEL